MQDTVDTTGLTNADVLIARRKHGWNELPAENAISRMRVFARQFSSLLVIILVLAAVIAFALGEWIDAFAIGMVILLNAALGFVQEWRAQTALAALNKLLSPNAMVIRNGKEQIIPAREIVPGDILVLSPGTKIAADAKLMRISNLSLDESILTGESEPVEKTSEDCGSLVFAGTSVTAGRAEALVAAIGRATEFGKIAQMTGEVGEKKTNLQEHLGRLARQLGFAAVVVAMAVGTLGLVYGRAPSEMVLMSLSLAVAMVPEGLPAVITITLALGATAMARQKALARRLQAIETLGAASVICTDKTGTLTENKMTATRIWTLDRAYKVTGTGYDPAGHISRNGGRIRAGDDPLLDELLQTGLHCNHATLVRHGDTWDLVGEPTEGALVTLAQKGWLDLPGRRAPLAEIPFSSERKRMSVLHQTEDGIRVLTKGAPEKVVEICSKVQTKNGERPISESDRSIIASEYEAMAEAGLRVIGLAARDAPNSRIVEEDLTFLGLVGLIDPPRAEVRSAIASARSAGIRTIMITGDSPITARAIAEQLTLPIDESITGTDMDEMDDATLRKKLAGNVLFARTKPKQKMRIVAALQALDNIVAMTGDGVNDAPALKRADIGVSMGIRGTDVARDASDLVLLDDNFATIVRAIREGRRQFGNVRKYIRYLLSSNAGEVIALVINIAIGGPTVFYATQILWMNLVTDSVTAVALGLEKAEPDQMQHPPRNKNSPILGLGGLASIIALGTYSGLASLWIFYHLLEMGTDIARTTAFTAMIVFEKFSVFAFRSLRLPGHRIGWFSNPLLFAALALMLCAQIAAVYWPVLQAMLRTVPIGWSEWQLIALFAVPMIIIPEALKMLVPPHSDSSA